MKNKVFEINVDFETKSAVDSDLIKIVKGDYNSIEFDLKMDKTDYKRAVLFLVKPNKKNFVVDIANSKAIFTEKNTFDEVGIYYYGIVLYGTNSKLTTSTKGKIQVVEGYNEDNEDVTGDDNYPILDKLIEEVTDLKDKINASLGVMNKTFKEVTYDPSTGVMSFKNLNNEVTNINLPLSLLISSASYDNDNKKIVLTLANNDTIDIPILDLVSNYYDDKINANKEYIASTSNELYRLKTDVLETGEDTNSYVHLEDSALSELQEISVDGVCQQVTTSGKNLIDSKWETKTLNGITITNNEDGTYTLNGTSTSSSTFALVNFTGGAIEHPMINNITNNVGKYITLSTGYSSSQGFYIQLNLSKQGGGEEQYGFVTVVNTYANKLISSNESEAVYINFFLGIHPNASFNNLKVYPMITIQDNQIPTAPTPTDFEPYTGGEPSPSPDYPQEIKTITDSLKVTSCNKNILQLDTTPFATTSCNVEILPTGYKLVAKGGYSMLILPLLKSKTLIGKQLTLSFTLQETQNWTDTYAVIAIISCDSTGNNRVNIAKYNMDKNSKDVIITGIIPETDNEYIAIRLYASTTMVDTSKETYAVYTNLMVSVNDTTPSYVDRLYSQIQTALPENEFIGKINKTYKDTLNVKYKQTDGHYHLILNKMIGKVVLDGSDDEIWNMYGTSGQRKFYLKDTFFGDKKPFTNNIDMSNRFTSTQYIGGSWALNKFGYHVSGKSMVFDTNFGESEEEWRTWLSTHNIELYYALATIYEVDLGIVDQLLSYDEITNIFTDSDLLPKINVKYYRNFITTIRNLQINNDTLKNELSNIENRLAALENASASEVSDTSADESEVSE